MTMTLNERYLGILAIVIFIFVAVYALFFMLPKGEINNQWSRPGRSLHYNRPIS